MAPEQQSNGGIAVDVIQGNLKRPPRTNRVWAFFMEGVMKIPKDLEIPAVVFGLQGVMLIGWVLVFLVL